MDPHSGCPQDSLATVKPDIFDLADGIKERFKVFKLRWKDVGTEIKKAWLTDRFADGLVFKKGDVRGKCFIEYIPAEMAWCPIEADGYMYIDCLSLKSLSLMAAQYI